MGAQDYQRNVAVVGGGVAGVTAAYLLQQRCRVTLFERNGYVGGHTRTWVLRDGPDAGTPVDTGFIVFNGRTYPNFIRLLGRLGVAYQPSEMSFSCFNESSGLAYAGTGLAGLFARPGSVVSPGHWRFLLGIIRFSRRAREALRDGTLGALSLGAFCAREGLSQAVVDDYVLPMASAIWSTPLSGIRDFPMASIARFYENHGLLSLRDRPAWYTVTGGSHTYVRRFLETFTGAVRTGVAVARVARDGAGVRLRLADGGEERFDAVVVAAHADEALALLEDPDPDERALLGAWGYSRNRTVLHTDEALMPPTRRAWASWNYLRLAGAGPDDPACLTYYMNRLQRLQARATYLVTLNPLRPVRPEARIADLIYEHPVYTEAAVSTQARLPELNGRRHTYFCGSYFRNGFHEDAVTAAVDVARRFDCHL